MPSLDSGRLVAALLVALFHNSFTIQTFTGARPLHLILRGGHAGVEYFFVLSGFVIYLVHARDLSQPHRLANFFWKRALRILPMLWLVLIIWGVFRIAFGSMTTNNHTGVGTLILDMLLIPHRGPLVLGVTWTLQRELVFYLLFSLAIQDRRLGLVVMAFWQVAVLALPIAGIVPTDPILSAVLDLHNVGFALGMGAAWLIMNRPAVRPRILIACGSLAFALLLLSEWVIAPNAEEDYLPLGPVFGPLAYTVSATVMVIGLARRDRLSPPKRTPIADYGGGASYVLYLVHGPVGSLAIRALLRFALPGEVLLLALTAAQLLAALLIHIWIERPILRFFARPRLPSPSRA